MGVLADLEGAKVALPSLWAQVDFGGLEGRRDDRGSGASWMLVFILGWKPWQMEHSADNPKEEDARSWNQEAGRPCYSMNFWMAGSGHLGLVQVG